MKKVLVFRAPYPFDRTMVWDVSEKYQRQAAYINLFRILDRELDAFIDPDSVICALLDLARNENPEACEALLCYRRNRGSIKEIEVTSPFGPRLEEPPRLVVAPAEVSDFDVAVDPENA